MNKTLTALAIFLVLGSTSAAFAQGPDLTAHASGSTRTERRFSLASVTSVTGGFPMVGLQAQYQLADRLALTSQASLGILAADAGLGARVFISAERRSGLYLDLSGHALNVFGAGLYGGVAELGYQFRAHSGFLFEVGAGVAVYEAGPDGCGCHPPSQPPRSPFNAFPELSVRSGYAF